MEKSSLDFYLSQMGESEAFEFAPSDLLKEFMEEGVADRKAFFFLWKLIEPNFTELENELIEAFGRSTRANKADDLVHTDFKNGKVFFEKFLTKVADLGPSQSSQESIL